MRKVFFFSTKCEKSFTFFDKMQKVFQFFLQSAESVYKMQYRLGNFLLVYNFFSVFPNMCAKSVRSSKVSSNCFSMVYLEPLIYSHN